MTGGAFYYYMYVCAVTKILSCSAAGLQDGQHFVSSLLERFREGSKSPSHYTPDMYPELRSRLYQGDIVLPVSRNAIISDYYKWPKAIIPYTIHYNFTQDERFKIRVAMDSIELKTCLKFVDMNGGNATQLLKEVGHSEYVYIGRERNKGCNAMIGYHREMGRPHNMNLESPSCLSHLGTVQHELLHVAGLLHEQARADRDNAVIIYWENIDKTYWPDFSKVPDNVTSTFGLPYDYTSVMHYPRYAFSKNGKETIVAKHEPSMSLGQRTAATVNDLRKVNAMYNCNGAAATPNTNAGSYQSDEYHIF
ncbi:hypothetical protein QTP88_002399 [Uroleucon formosanum]